MLRATTRDQEKLADLADTPTNGCLTRRPQATKQGDPSSDAAIERPCKNKEWTTFTKGH